MPTLGLSFLPFLLLLGAGYAVGACSRRSPGAPAAATAASFNFLTGPEPAIRSLLAQFGVIAEPSENIWKHTLATLLIDRDGKIGHRIDGSAWEAENVLKRL
jgi:protein SCO1/2